MGADYVMALKDNHPTLRAEVEGIFESERAAQKAEQGFKREGSTKAADVFETNESGHGREETRRVHSLEAPEWLYEKEEWTHLSSLIMVVAKRELNDQMSIERGYYIAKYFAN